LTDILTENGQSEKRWLKCYFDRLAIACADYFDRLTVGQKNFRPTKLVKITFLSEIRSKLGFQIFENRLWEFLTNDILIEIGQKSKFQTDFDENFGHKTRILDQCAVKISVDKL